MDLNENGSLHVIEQLLEEFFNTNTSNTRKHEIEQELNLFKCVPHLWNLCLYFITNTSSQYVTMFSLSVLENVINQQWMNSNWAHKNDLRSILYNYLIEKGNHAPHFLREKYTKLLVDIAKQDWPHNYPNFMDNILELLRADSNKIIGLLILRTTSEEFMGLNTSLDKHRKDELFRLLQPYIPHIFEILGNILEALGNRCEHAITATPPPSPTYPSSTLDVPKQLASATFRPDSKTLKREVLNTLQHIYSWVPISNIPSRMIKSVFNLTNISTYAQDDDDICVLSMSTINELLYRKCTPPGTQQFFILLYHHTVELLRDLHSSPYRIESLDPAFVEKLSELLVLLIEQHFWRLELEPNFSAIEFLSLLFQLTVQVPSVQSYTRCLTAWIAFIKQIKPQNAHKYSQAFVGLTGMILKKIQFNTNSCQLTQINMFETNEDNETEWTEFVKTSNEVIALCAEYTPWESFNQVLVPWKVQYEKYKDLSCIINESNFTLTCDDTESERLSHTLSDFSTLTQTISGLAFLFLDHEFEIQTAEETISCLFDKLLETALVTSSGRFCRVKSNQARVLKHFTDVHNALLSSLKTWLAWTLQKNKLDSDKIKALTDVTIPVLLEGLHFPHSISRQAAYLLLGLTTQIFAPKLMVFQAVSSFISLVPSLKFHDMETHHLVNSSVCNLLFKSWGSVSQDDTSQRHYVISMFFDLLTKDFRSLSPSSEEHKVREAVDLVLPSVSYIIGFCTDFPTTSKKMLFLALKSTIEHALNVFPAFTKYPDVSQQILTLFIQVFEVLQQQYGMDSTKDAVNIFLQAAVSGQSASSPSNIEKLLQIFKLVIEAPGSAYKTFLPGILDLCMQHIWPAVVNQARDYPEVYISLLNLLSSVLIHRWQYFYLSQVKSGYSPCVNNDSESNYDTPHKPQEFLSILQIFGQALLQQDINVFRLSLTALEDLNTRWNLFNKQIFRDYLLHKFMAVLMRVLLEKSHALLSDDIQIAMYHMASVNFQDFLTAFLPEFLRSIHELSGQQCEILLRCFLEHYDKDMPTFIQRLRVFVKDVQQLRICNLKQQGTVVS